VISRNRALLLACFALLFKITSAAQEVGYNIHPDARFKADLLVIVAHPDDESEIGSYLARAVFDQHKRVAVIFGTRGNTGGNAQGGEQSMSLGLIREIEGRRAVAYFGITNVWFLGAPDTAGQSVLHSLETWNHGRCLEEVTRIVRLTQPDVIATWLPDYSAGENHGDHQASGVLATEAFDIAGDPTQFPEQIAPPRFPTGISNMTEGLLPWQPQKLYYFSDAANTDFMNGQGPSYNAGDISPSKKESYARLAAEEVSFHLTQSDSGAAARRALDRDQVEKTYLAQPARMILGKSHVPCSRTGDVFEGVTRAISFQRVTPHPFPEKSLRLQLGGAWHF
jgi:LmbE family N-acetylglucosaminyl deacetylase